MSHDAVTTLANQVKREFRRRLVEEQLPRITTQWIMAQFTEVRDQRQRDAEFATETGLSVAQLSSRLHEVYTTACDTVDTVSTEQLLANRTVQGYAETGLSAILHVLEHTSGHAGQIYAWTKQATGLDLKFYDL
jgi:uncharacterized damage-inducible protein DinB